MVPHISLIITPVIFWDMLDNFWICPHYLIKSFPKLRFIELFLETVSIIYSNKFFIKKSCHYCTCFKFNSKVLKSKNHSQNYVSVKNAKNEFYEFIKKSSCNFSEFTVSSLLLWCQITSVSDNAIDMEKWSLLL